MHTFEATAFARVGRASIFVIFGFAALAMPLAAATTYTVTNLGDLPGGDDFSRAAGINAFGQVVGLTRTTTGNRAFLWSPSTLNGTAGSMIDLGDLPGGGDSSIAHGINDFGQIAGSSSANENSAFLWTPTTPNGTAGSMMNLGDLPGGTAYTFAFGINASGQVVGGSSATAAAIRAFLWTPTTPNGTSGSMTDLGDLPGGGNGSLANSINAVGQVVGDGDAATGERAFLWTPTSPNGTGGSMTDLGDLPGFNDRSSAQSINASGHVVGGSHSSITYTGNHAFLWTPADGMLDLNLLLDTSGAGWQLTLAEGINDFGQIVGNGDFDADGPGGAPPIKRGFLLTPVPEPSSIVLALVASLCVFGWRLRSIRHVYSVGRRS